jgi:glycosyltransferase involved in cell wall biosynthesis
MSVRPKIAIFNLNMTHRDPRVLRISATLRARGAVVAVFEMQQNDMPAQDVINGVTIYRVPVPQSYTDADMAEFEWVCPAAAQVISEASLEVYGCGGRCGGSAFRRTFDRLPFRLRRPPRAKLSQTEQSNSEDVASIRSIMLVNLAIFRAAERYRADIIHCNDLDTLLAGYIFQRKYSTKIIFDAHEIYPEQLPESMRSQIWYDFYTNLEKRLINEADGRLTVCDSLGRYFASRYNTGGFVTIRNLPSRTQLPDRKIVSSRIKKPLRFLYHGSYSRYRGLDEIIQASCFMDGAEFVFRGIGSYVQVLKRLSIELGVDDRVTFADPVGVAELVSSAAECDVGLNPFIPVCKNTEYALPNKFFEYLMAGLACASSNLIEIREHTMRYDIGILFEKLEPEAIAVQLQDLVDNPDRVAHYRANALKAAHEELHWENEEKKFAAFYQQFLE